MRRLNDKKVERLRWLRGKGLTGLQIAREVRVGLRTVDKYAPAHQDTRKSQAPLTGRKLSIPLPEATFRRWYAAREGKASTNAAFVETLLDRLAKG